MQVNVNGKMLKLPDFMIIGAARSGTTSLYYYLSQHPDIFMPDRKEPQYFSYKNEKAEYKEVVSDLNEYVDLFTKSASNELIGEGSTSYLYMGHETIKSIKEIYGESYRDIKIIMILRDPVKRAFSHYLFMSKIGKENMQFDEAIQPDVISRRIKLLKGFDYIGHGDYYQRVREYLNNFDNVKVVIDKDLYTEDKLVKELLEFLNLDSSIPINTNIIVNPSGVPKGWKERMIALFLLKGGKYIKKFTPNILRLSLVKTRDRILRLMLKTPVISDESSDILADVFREKNSSLAKLINRDLSHWTH